MGDHSVMARTAPVPNIPAIPGMNPGVWIMGGGAAGGGGAGKGGRGSGDGQGANGQGGGNGANGGGKNAASCGPGSGGGCPNPAHGNRGTHAGDPVDPITGRVYTVSVVDLALPGALPLFIRRSYSSAYREEDVGLGFGWMHSLAWSIVESRRTLRVIDPLGAPTTCDKPAMDETVRLPCGQLRRYEGGYVLDTGDGRAHIFRREDALGGCYRLTRFVDENGNAIQLFYSAKGLETILDSAGRAVRVRRHASGRIAAFEVKNAPQQGRWVSFRSYTHDERGDLVAAVDACGNAERFAYDEEHRLASRLSAAGLAVEFRYDGRGRCVESWCLRAAGETGLDERVPDTLADGQTNAKGFLHVRIDHYDGFSEVITSRSVRRIVGNALGEVDMMTWGRGVHSKKFDDAGALLSYQDASSATWLYSRDPVGQIVREIDPLGAVTEHEYDSRGLLAATRYPLGDVVRYTRDDSGNLLSLDDDSGQVATFAYDPRGLLIEATMPEGRASRMAYDHHANRVAVMEPDGAVRRLRYDYLGRLLSAVDERGFETTFTYDDNGLLRSIRKPSGATTRYDYDGDGDLVRVTRPDGRFDVLVRGGHHQVVAVVRSDGACVQYRYDREQDLVRIINEAGDEHRLDRDGEGRVVAERTFDGRTIQYDHDLNGRIVSVKHDGGDRVDVVYDDVGRILERNHSDGWTERYEYDLAGRMVAAENGEVTCRFEHDARGNVVRQSTTYRGVTEVVEAEHDRSGKRRLLRLPGRKVRFALDAAGRPMEVQIEDDARLQLAYDRSGYEVGRLLPGGGRIDREYDPDGTMVRLSVRGTSRRRPLRPGEPMWVGEQQGDETLVQSFGWSPSQDLLWIEDRHEGGTRIEHESRGRIATRQAAKGRREVFRYGVAGEMYDASSPGSTRRYGPGGRIEERDGVSYTYDARGRLVEKRAPGPAGAMDCWTFAWGPHGLLQAVTGPTGRVEFAYDPFARRVEKRSFSGRELVSVTRYLWDGEVVVRSVEERYDVNGGKALEERDYLYLRDDILPSAQRVRRNGEAAPWHYVVADGLGMLPQAIVRADGAVAQRLDPSLFGRMDAPGESATQLRLPGQIADRETGLHYNRYRYYDPDAGTFLSPEPLGIEASLMPYAYADNEPHRAFDPDGLAVPSRVRGSAGTTEVNAGGRTAVVNGQRQPLMPLHPAVAAALPNSNARENPNHSMLGCGDPHAFSEYLYQWENQNGRRCDPATRQGRSALRDALQSIDRFESERTSPNRPTEAFTPCPNCSQTISRLYGLAGLHPPRNATSAETPPVAGANPAMMRDGRRSPPGPGLPSTTGTYDSPHPSSQLRQAMNQPGGAAAQSRANRGEYASAVAGASADPRAAQWNQGSAANPNAPLPNAGIYDHNSGRWERR
ncbi:RHS repeat-associated core domain-containing protein [Sorangium sp. So ce385]|uniref:RHS repeat-associated core domain-containing protein n=1 Tax=Sorangium sp. So ce385 TaxID=3133308 RepID=UPI003F5B5259